jgi:hypothetical protein
MIIFVIDSIKTIPFQKPICLEKGWKRGSINKTKALPWAELYQPFYL